MCTHTHIYKHTRKRKRRSECSLRKQRAILRLGIELDKQSYLQTTMPALYQYVRYENVHISVLGSYQCVREMKKYKLSVASSAWPVCTGTFLNNGPETECHSSRICHPAWNYLPLTCNALASFLSQFLFFIWQWSPPFGRELRDVE